MNNPPPSAPLSPAIGLPPPAEADAINWEQIAKALPEFNFVAIHDLFNSVDAFIRMLNVFLQDFSTTDATLTQLIAQGDLLAAERCLHTLKGVVGVIGAQQLYNRSQALDCELKKGFFLDGTLQQWQTAFTTTLATLRAFIAQQQPLLPAPLQQDCALLAAIFTELENLLSLDEFIADSLLITLQHQLPEHLRETYQRLYQAVAQTDYQDAQHILSLLRQGL